ncbi:hypothetical protein LINPERPRIM_LOCUS6585, partial [Linum perenne]
AKQAWHILANPETLWAKLLKSWYFPSSGFLSAKKGSRRSLIWASLCSARTVMNLRSFRALGDGSSTFIGLDP